MQVGKVDVGPVRWGGVPSTGIPMSQQDREKLRDRRNLGLRKLKTLGLITLIISVLDIVIGIATLIVAARGKIGWPVFNFGVVIVGVIMTITGFLAFSAGRKEPDLQTTDVENTPGSVKCQFVGHYVLSVTCIGFCVVAGTFGFLVAGVCSSDSDSDLFGDVCKPDKGANVALGAVGGLLCITLAVLCIVACVYFCMFARSFGFKNRYERMMEYQMGMMMRAMQEQQQSQGQFQGQSVQGQGQWERYAQYNDGFRGTQYSSPPPPYR